jgi:VanZ family protein
LDLLRAKARFLTFLALFTWMGVILFLSSRSTLPGDAVIVSWLHQYRDEVGHLGEYSVLGLLTYIFLKFFMTKGKAVLSGLTFCVLFALGDEAFQGLIPNRTSEFKDILLDTVGATSAVAAAALLKPCLRMLCNRAGVNSNE